MTCRVAWKPYIHSLTLPDLLAGVQTPTLIVWGAQDLIVPLECAARYREAIKRSELVTIESCGHMPEMEIPAEFAGLVTDCRDR